jgi:hypothetical protein
LLLRMGLVGEDVAGDLFAQMLVGEHQLLIARELQGVLPGRLLALGSETGSSSCRRWSSRRRSSMPAASSSTGTRPGRGSRSRTTLVLSWLRKSGEGSGMKAGGLNSALSYCALRREPMMSMPMRCPGASV